MTKDEFWSIVDSVHVKAGGDMDKKCDLLRERLGELDPDSMRDFRTHFDECNRRAYDWGLWGAAYVMNGGCSDDGFSDFRSTLISHGRSVFERALADPDSLAELPLDEDGCYEGYAYVVTDAETAILGDDSPDPVPFPDEPSGEPWDHDDDAEVAARFPRLHRKYSSSSEIPDADRLSKKPWWKIW